MRNDCSCTGSGGGGGGGGLIFNLSQRPAAAPFFARRRKPQGSFGSILARALLGVARLMRRATLSPAQNSGAAPNDARNLFVAARKQSHALANKRRNWKRAAGAQMTHLAARQRRAISAPLAYRRRRRRRVAHLCPVALID